MAPRSAWSSPRPTARMSESMYGYYQEAVPLVDAPPAETCARPAEVNTASSDDAATEATTDAAA